MKNEKQRLNELKDQIRASENYRHAFITTGLDVSPDEIIERGAIDEILTMSLSESINDFRYKSSAEKLSKATLLGNMIIYREHDRKVGDGLSLITLKDDSGRSAAVLFNGKKVKDFGYGYEDYQNMLSEIYEASFKSRFKKNPMLVEYALNSVDEHISTYDGDVASGYESSAITLDLIIKNKGLVDMVTRDLSRFDNDDTTNAVLSWLFVEDDYINYKLSEADYISQPNIKNFVEGFTCDEDATDVIDKFKIYKKYKDIIRELGNKIEWVDGNGGNAILDILKADTSLDSFKREFSSKMARYKTSEALNEALVSYAGSTSMTLAQEYIDDECFVSEIEPGVILMHLRSTDDVKRVAPTAWCIRDKEYFNRYTSNFKRQYMIVDTNVGRQDQMHKYGITVDIDGKITDAYDQWDHDCKSDIKDEIIGHIPKINPNIVAQMVREKKYTNYGIQGILKLDKEMLSELDEEDFVYLSQVAEDIDSVVNFDHEKAFYWYIQLEKEIGKEQREEGRLSNFKQSIVAAAGMWDKRVIISHGEMISNTSVASMHVEDKEDFHYLLSISKNKDLLLRAVVEKIDYEQLDQGVMENIVKLQAQGRINLLDYENGKYVIGKILTMGDLDLEDRKNIYASLGDQKYDTIKGAYYGTRDYREFYGQLIDVGLGIGEVKEMAIDNRSRFYDAVHYIKEKSPSLLAEIEEFVAGDPEIIITAFEDFPGLLRENLTGTLPLVLENIKSESLPKKYLIGDSANKLLATVFYNGDNNLRIKVMKDVGIKNTAKAFTDHLIAGSNSYSTLGILRELSREVPSEMSIFFKEVRKNIEEFQENYKHDSRIGYIYEIEMRDNIKNEVDDLIKLVEILAPKNKSDSKNRLVRK